MDGGGGLVATRNRRDRRARAGDDLAAGENARNTCGQQRAVYREKAAVGQKQVRARDDGAESGCLADGEHDDIGGKHDELIGELRGEAALRVEHRQAALQLQAGDLAVLGHHFVGTP